MRKIIVLVLFGVALVWAAVVFIPSYLNRYAVFSSPISQPAVKFQYPSKWKIKVEQGKIDSYTQVYVIGPRNAKDTYTTTMIIREIPIGSQFSSLGSLKQDRIDHIYRKAEVHDQRSLLVGGKTAESLTAKQTLPPLRIKGIQQIPIDLKTRHVYAENDRKLYELIFNSDVELFDKYVGDFEHLVATFRFEGN